MNTVVIEMVAVPRRAFYGRKSRLRSGRRCEISEHTLQLVGQG